MKILEKIAQIKDPRMQGKIQYSLESILFATLCAVISGAQSFEDIKDYWAAKKSWLDHYAPTDSIPSSDTIRRVFTLLEPSCLEHLLISHAREVVSKGKVCDQICLDGKVLKGSFDQSRKALCSLSAFCPSNQVVLSEKQVRRDKAEMSSLPALLETLNLKGHTVTVDAAGAYQSIIEKIREKKAEYVIGLKANQPKAYKAAKAHFEGLENQIDYKIADGFDQSHGRLVRRRYFAFSVKKIEQVQGFSGIKSIIAVETISSFDKDLPRKIKAHWRYYLSSHIHTNVKLAQYVRSHWSIENSLHWVLDVHLKEDDDLKKQAQTVRCFALLKRIVLNLVRANGFEKKKISLRRQLNKASWNNDYLLSLLGA